MSKKLEEFEQYAKSLSPSEIQAMIEQRKAMLAQDDEQLPPTKGESSRGNSSLKDFEDYYKHASTAEINAKIAELKGLSIPEYEWTKAIPKSLARGGLQYLDLMQMINQYAIPKALGGLPHGMPSATEIVNERLKKHAGIDLHSESRKAETSTQKIFGERAPEWLASAPARGLKTLFTGVKGLGKLAPQALAALGKRAGSQVAKDTALLGTSGAVSGGLQELGVNPMLADIGSSLGVSGGANKVLNYLSNRKLRLAGIKPLDAAEARTQAALRSQMGETAYSQVGQQLQHPVDTSLYPQGYNPLTAEVTQSPYLAGLHETRKTVRGSGIKQAQVAQNDALAVERARQTSGMATPGEINDFIDTRKADYTNKRHEATHEGWETLKRDTTRVPPSASKAHIKGERTARGKIAKDVNNFKKDIKTKFPISDAEIKAQKHAEDSYHAGLEQIKAAEEALKNAPKKRGSPKAQSRAEFTAAKKQLRQEYQAALKAHTHPTVGELSGVRESLNASLDALANPRGARARNLIASKKALFQDVEAIPLYKQTADAYTELSKPINQITKQSAFFDATGKRKNPSNRVVQDLFNKQAPTNWSALKETYAKHPEEWAKVQKSVVDHMWDSSLLKGVKDPALRFSPDKFIKFLKTNGEVVKDVLTKAQLKLVGQLYHVIRGRGAVSKLGIGGIDKKALEKGLQPAPNIFHKTANLVTSLTTLPLNVIPGKPGKIIGNYLHGLIKSSHTVDSKELYTVVDRILKEPAYANFIINSKVTNPRDFKDLMRLLNRNALPIAAQQTKKDED